MNQNQKNRHPYIIAIGNSKREIDNFYIDIEKNLIIVWKLNVNMYCFLYNPSIFQIPPAFNFAQTMDFFVKLHRVFDVNYNPVLKNALNLLDKIVYGNDTIQMTAKMIEVTGKLVSNNNIEMWLMSHRALHSLQIAFLFCMKRKCWVNLSGTDIVFIIGSCYILFIWQSKIFIFTPEFHITSELYAYWRSYI